MTGIALLCYVLTFQQAKPQPLAPRDTATIQRVARAHLKSDAPSARLVSRRGDTVYVNVGNHVSWTLVRVVRRDSLWVALKDSITVTGIR